MRITAVEHVTLDGVMQAPGAPDEDTRDGFEHGGWSAPYGDQVLRVHGPQDGRWRRRRDVARSLDV